ncbi:serine protease [Streptomyces sp. NPDC005438]|uniref:S1 family peptidase n=1 Tax=Streptomyces sp. NPDC005438 TaxID=3156880 RepID=UPI0033A59BD9
MKRPLIASVASVVLGAGALVGVTGGTAGAAEAPKATPNFNGIVALSNCSGSVIKVPDSQPDDPALVLSNGHCLEEGMPGPDEVVVDQPSSRSFTLLNDDASEAGTLTATKVAYGTMTSTDMSVYETDSTYAELEEQYSITPLEVQAEAPEAGGGIHVVSGYWQKVYSCKADGFAHQLKEADWTFDNSMRYTEECDTIGGTSGSPVVDDATGKVVGVNNTSNEDGEECTMNNPCEVDENGEVTIHQGIGYAQQTHKLVGCVAEGNKIDLDKEGCELPKP